jgi:hypothetical protein
MRLIHVFVSLLTLVGWADSLVTPHLHGQVSPIFYGPDSYSVLSTSLVNSIAPKESVHEFRQVEPTHEFEKVEVRVHQTKAIREGSHSKPQERVQPKEESTPVYHHHEKKRVRHYTKTLPYIQPKVDKQYRLLKADDRIDKVYPKVERRVKEVQSPVHVRHYKEDYPVKDSRYRREILRKRKERRSPQIEPEHRPLKSTRNYHMVDRRELYRPAHEAAEELMSKHSKKELVCGLQHLYQRLYPSERKRIAKYCAK